MADDIRAALAGQAAGKRLIDVFRALDTDRSRQIDKREFTIAVRRLLGARTSVQAIEQV